jgi:carboxypeptidase D
MVPYDLPDISHDMILRFMGTNFSAIAEGSARIPSKVGDNIKPVPVLLEGEGGDGSTIPVPAGKTPEQDKAMWEGELMVNIQYSRIN